MKIILIILAVLISAFTIYLFILGIHSRSKDIPGLIDGHLLKCPNSPNFISTENKDHVNHYLPPIPLPKNLNVNPFIILKDIIHTMGGSIQIEKLNYLAATYSSAIFKFVDDLEIRIDNKQEVIHIRSASRVGRGDMGVNKKRVKLLKQLFKNNITKTGQE